MSKKFLSYEAMMIILDIAAENNTDDYSAIWTKVDNKFDELRKSGKLFEDTPGIKTGNEILSDFQNLSPKKVIDYFPRHIWQLRKDYENIISQATKPQN